MEAEERPTKLRKLSHDQSRSEVPLTKSQPGDSSAEPGPHESSEAAAHDAETSGLPGDTFTATKLAAASAATLSGLPMPDTTVDPSNTSSTASGLSKNQLKKLKRKVEWEAGREDRKAKRRAKDKEKKIRRRAEREEARANAKQNGNGNHDNHDGIENGTKNLRTRPQKLQRWQQKKNRILLPISLVLDCSFDNLMTDGEIISMGSQLTRCYSDNTKTPYASHFYVSSWKPETELRKRFEVLMRGMYKNWKGITFIEEDFVEAGKLAHAAMTGPSGGKMAGMFTKYQDTTTPKTTTESNENSTTPISPDEPSTNPPSANPSSLPTPKSPQIIYLTSDSPHTLTTLTPYTTYIIGGLVDKNRHKSLCYNTAVRRGIPTAKLPLAEYMQMTSRQVLTTNHVVEIMLRWLEVGDWGDAFLSVLPKRKGAVLRGRGTEAEGEGSGSGEEESYSEGEGRSDGDGGDDDDDSSIDINVTRGRDTIKAEDKVKAEV